MVNLFRVNFDLIGFFGNNENIVWDKILVIFSYFIVWIIIKDDFSVVFVF